MPLYDYKCSACGKSFEIRHGFNERHEAPCEACGGRLVRVFNPAPIVFKGSGFYVTDSRKGSASNGTSKADGAKADGAKGEPAKPDAPKPDAPKADAPNSGTSKPADSAA